MTQRRPIFGFLWPDRTPTALDGDYVQERLIRIPTRSAVTLIVLMLASLLLVSLAGSAIIAAAATSWLLVIPVAVILATLTVLMLRAWTIGTYVNDAGIAVQRLLRTVAARWDDVEAVYEQDGRVIVRTRSGRAFDTTISLRSLDILGRREAYDMAKLALQRWGERR
jgi:hypothetical protein